MLIPRNPTWPLPGDDPDDVNTPGFKFFGGKACARHTRQALLDWWKIHDEDSHVFLILKT